MSLKEGIRINKFLSQCGFSSRRQAEELIKNKKVIINNKFAILGQKIYEKDVVLVNQKQIEIKHEKKYYLINKPKKTLCTLKDNFNRQIITDLIDDNDYLFPVGRLDYNTTGVLLITNDGELAHKLTHPSFNIKRVYRARLDQSLSKKEILFLNSDKVIVNEKKSKQIIEQIDKKSYLVTLWEGSYHHVKKIFEQVNKKVYDLKRVEFAGLNCEKMPVGSYRSLKIHEIKLLKKLVEI
ncbi:MAG: rRNA pseudouridine synthase [Mycoplasmataceae bacterium]|nr:rRNA pseudouridine synthase [Mycoplasmataceae bacterium]